MKVIISGGGTGGHIFPAIAIAKAIEAKRPGTEILFVGAEGKMEMEKVPAAGYKIIGLPIVGIQRRLTWKNLLVPFKLLASMLKARRVIRDFKPDIAVGVGGYASGPLLRTAGAAGIPTVIQEQNSYPGITNKLLSGKVNRICVAYEGLEKFFPSEKIVFTGNPVRPDVAHIEGKRERAMQHFQLDPSRKTILIIGGSLGARTINLAVQGCAENWVSEGFQVVWQTGKTFASVAQEFARVRQHIHVYDFIREMDLAYAAADVVVSRAGAMSISELCLVKKPSVFVPSPNVSEDHQTKNALALVNRDAALWVKDVEAIDTLGSTVSLLINDEDRMSALSEKMGELARPDAAGHIADIVIELAGS